MEQISTPKTSPPNEKELDKAYEMISYEKKEYQHESKISHINKEHESKVDNEKKRNQPEIGLPSIDRPKASEQIYSSTQHSAGTTDRVEYEKMAPELKKAPESKSSHDKREHENKDKKNYEKAALERKYNEQKISESKIPTENKDREIKRLPESKVDHDKIARGNKKIADSKVDHSKMDKSKGSSNVIGNPGNLGLPVKVQPSSDPGKKNQANIRSTADMSKAGLSALTN